MNKKHIKYGKILFSLFATFIFCVSNVSAQDNAYVPIKTVVKTTPASSNNIVSLPSEGGSIGIFLGESVGDISEYRIDLNILEDSNRDGVKDNDIDNEFHSSFKTGGTFPISIRPSSEEVERKIKVTVIGADKSESEAVITVIFGGAVADEIVTIDLGATDTSQIQDDFVVDDSVDDVLVDDNDQVVDDIPDLDLSDMFDDLPVKDDLAPVGDIHIDVTTQGADAVFEVVLPNNLNRSAIDPVWDFGDGSKSYLLNPVHEYAESGEYDVSLQLSDVITRSVIGSSATRLRVTVEPTVDTGGSGLIGSLAFIFKVACFVFVLLLLITGVVFILMFLKSQREGISLSEVVGSYKKKLAGEVDSGVSDKKEEVVTAEVVDEKVAGYAKPEPVKMKVEKEKRIPDPDSIDNKDEEKKLEPVKMKVEEKPKPEPPKPEPVQPPKFVPPKPQPAPPKSEPSKPIPPKSQPAPPKSEPSKPIPPKSQIVPKKEKAEVPVWLKEGVEEVAPEERQAVLEGDTSKAVTSSEGISEAPKEETQESQETKDSNEPKDAKESVDLNKKEEDKAEEKNEAEEPIAFIKAEGVADANEENQKDNSKPDSSRPEQNP
ncbi:PKD domain-containing protein [Candidatus Peribacteria bacterium]|jgi:PKD repeat protein|nr:PKD domain-containing protein [Candidatus Peribacteria bacterium]MBT4240506.1 PKD domain-containing protein [Candidatus Peribacteria bacterium]MBT4474313.1 PKD domain-containing protein [Candidatus Peribacteria bacterium]